MMTLQRLLTSTGQGTRRSTPTDLPQCIRGWRDATALVDAGAVRIDGETTYVRSGDVEHVVRSTADGDRCTCPWFAKHKRQPRTLQARAGRESSSGTAWV